MKVVKHFVHVVLSILSVGFMTYQLYDALVRLDKLMKNKDSIGEIKD